MQKHLLIMLAVFTLVSLNMRGSGLDEPVGNEIGFITIEPIRFHFQYQDYSSRLELQSSPAHIWYHFQASDRNERDTPIFVFFNGGPGSATSCGLMSMNTGRWTLDPTINGGGDSYIPNSHSWTQMGHLLYIDAREAGFSYNTMNNPSDYMERWREFNAQNFNCFFDGADYVRVILRFLAQHPALIDHPVVIVGESYGGIRATVLLYLIHQYRDLANGVEMYQDPALNREIQSHFDRVFPEYAGRSVPREVIARQFGHQVLIQACVSFGHQVSIADALLRQPGSVIYQLAEEIGIPYNGQTEPLTWVANTAKRDNYIYRKPAGWLNSFFAKGAYLLSFSSQLTRITGCDIRGQSDMYAERRQQAYRLVNLTTTAAAGGGGSRGEKPITDSVSQALFLAPELLTASHRSAEPGDLSAVFGILQPWDRYYMSLNGSANQAFHFYNIALIRGFETHYRDHRFGRMFLRNLLHIHTFVTNAAFDLVVYSPAIPPSLAKHTDLVDGVVPVGPFQNSQPSELTVRYKAKAFPEIETPVSRTIRFPYYDQSCHAVSLTQPGELLQDVRQWLSDSGLALQPGGNR